MSARPFDLHTAPLEEGTVLLEASAGTGKTYTLVGILLRLLLEGAIDSIDEALVVTFTVAATDELKNRLRAGLLTAIAACEGEPTTDPFFRGLARHGDKGVRILRAALEQFDQVAIATIHGFCKRVLDESAFESREPFDVEFALDELPLWERAAEDALRALRTIDSPTLGVVLLEGAFSPAELVTHYRLWQRYPDVLLEPDPPDAAGTVDALRRAALATVALFDGAAREQILGFRWKKGENRLLPDPEVAVAKLAERLQRAPELAIPDLLGLSRAGLAKPLLKNSGPRNDHSFFAGCDAVHAAFTTATTHVRSTLLHAMHDKAEQHKRTDRVLSFTDLLVRTATALRDPAREAILLPALRARYQTALIDEFQDTDPIQYAIFATCFQQRPIFLVGDPKQSIYSFRGADLETYFAARHDAVDTRTLAENHRSSMAMVHATNLLFARENAFVDTRLQFAPVRAAAAPGQLQIDGDPGAALRWRLLPPDPDKGDGLWPVDLAEPRIAADVAAEISRLLHTGCTLDGKPLRPHHIAILTRTNKQATLVQDTLRAAGIVSAIGKAGDVFATEELAEIERLMLAILHPNDLRKARAAMATRLWGHDAASLRRLDDDTLDVELGRLERWRQTWLRRGFVVMKEQMLADLDTEARLLAITGGERRLTNCQQLFEMLHQAEHEHHLSPEALLQWFQRERDHQDEIDYQRRELRLESDEDAVQILTVHGSKGLQYEIVFCPFAWGGRGKPRPPVLLQQRGVRRIDFEPDVEDAAFHAVEAERLAEDVRLVYVAITRSKRRCYVHWGPIGSVQGGSWRSALGWLLRRDPVDRGQTDWIATWFKACKAEAMRCGDGLRELVAHSEGTMSVDDVPPEPAPEPVRMPFVADTAAPRVARRKPRAFALHSFTSMVKGAPSAEPAPEVADPPDAPPLETGAVPSRGIFAFQRGALAGQCLHAILEHTDLRTLDERADGPVPTLVRATLQKFGLLDPAAHSGEIEPLPCVMANLQQLAGARIEPDGPTLAALCGPDRIAEWPFTLPLPHADGRELAAAFRSHGGAIARDYAPRLEQMQTRTLQGFLTGFLDLVTQHDGRYWVVDWKSNHLGDTAAHYGEGALRRTMHEHDYVLQYHLYLLALHRHLAQRVPDYDPARHLGGACYVFLRGARAGSHDGIFLDRPPLALLGAMDLWASGAHDGGRA